jgi:aryl-alcohol dehydrogenase-like predicted oxidoreductase
VRAALEAGITTFDTADTYANGRAETILGDALAGERRESLEILTKVFGATGPGGPNDSGLSRRHIHESINASLTRLQTDYVDLYQAHRYDFSTPLEETMEAFADVVRAGKALYIGVSEWTPEQLRAGHALARDLKIRSSRTSRSTTRSTGSSSQRPCRPARSWVSARSASPRSSRASSPASTSRASQSHKTLAPPTLMARSSSRAY